MKAAVLVMAALQLQAVLGGHFSVRMPFSNPAGVTYVEGPAPVGLAAGPYGYAAAAPQGVYAAHAYAAPVAHAYAAPVAHAYAAPVAYAAQHVKTASVGYAAVPTVQHVPAVHDVPYTRYEATAGVVQKVLDVAKPAVATRRFQIRRPAIQKQFYDIEERTVVRNAGSALVELEQPLSKTQQGATVVSAAAPVLAAAPLAYATHAKVLAPAVAGLPAYPAYPAYPTYPALSASPIVAAPVQQTLYPQEGQPQQQFEQPQQQFEQPQQQFEQPQQQLDQPQEQPQQQFEQPQQDQPQQQFEQPQQQQDQPQQQFEQPQQQFEQPQQQFEQPQQDDSIEVSNPEIINRAAAPQQPEQPAPEAAAPAPAPQARAIPTPEDLLRQFASSPALRQLQAEGEALEVQRQQLQARMARLVQQQQQQRQDAEALAARQRHLADAHASQPAAQTEARFAPAPRGAAPAPRALGPAPAPRQPAPVVESRSLGLSSLESLIPAARSGNEVVPSVRNLSPEQSQDNQQRLIELLTAQGGVAEVGSARSGPASAPVGDAGQVRARVLSATPAPEHGEPANERVQTRRVVVSRPIETVQEIDVVEPFTKIHRVAVQQPALFKTAVQDVARVHTSVPVYGKALTPYTVYH